MLVEKSVEGRIGDFILGLNIGKRCAIITDSNVSRITERVFAGIAGKFQQETLVADSLEKEYLRGISLKLSSFDFVLAAGGGRVIDAAKYSSSLAGKPWIAFPTLLSHDGIISSRASIEENGSKAWADADSPSAVIADLGIIKNAPYRFLASGCGDLLSNISAVNDWKLAESAGKEKYNSVIAGMSLLSSEAVIRNLKEIRSRSYKGIEALFWGLVSSGIAMNLFGSSRPCSGSEHNFSHALDKILGKESKLHGEQVALGTLISLCLQKKDWKSMKKTMQMLKLPVNAKEIGIIPEILAKALSEARSIRERHCILDKYDLDEKKSGKLLEKLGII